MKVSFLHWLIFLVVLVVKLGNCRKVLWTKTKGRLDLEKGGSRPRSDQFVCGPVFTTTPLGQGTDLRTVHLRTGECRVQDASFAARTSSLVQNSVFKKCDFKSQCVAAKTLVTKVLLLDGPRDVENHVNCDCVKSTQACTRYSNIRVFHEGTGHEQAVDVGRCIGSCKNGKKQCRPISSSTVSVSGPNGALCVSRVEKCACACQCHRVSFHQLYSVMKLDMRTNTTQAVDQVIDVGRCVGGCTGNKKAKCLFWADNPQVDRNSKEPQKVCVLWTPGKGLSHRCLPKLFKSRMILTVNAGPKLVNIIKQCKCS